MGGAVFKNPLVSGHSPEPVILSWKGFFLSLLVFSLFALWSLEWWTYRCNTSALSHRGHAPFSASDEQENHQTNLPASDAYSSTDTILIREKTQVESRARKKLPNNTPRKGDSEVWGKIWDVAQDISTTEIYVCYIM